MRTEMKGRRVKERGRMSKREKGEGGGGGGGRRE